MGEGLHGLLSRSLAAAILMDGWCLVPRECPLEARSELRGRLEAEQPVNDRSLGADEQDVGNRGDAVEPPERGCLIEVDGDDLEPGE